MYSPLTPKAKSKFLFPKTYIRGLIVAMAATFAVIGCDSNQPDKPETKVQILENEVVIDNSLVQTSTPERYQPSYNLQGELEPIENTDVKSPYPVLEATIKVEEGEKVEQGQALAEIKTEIAENKIPFVADEFLEVYVEGEQVASNSNSNSKLESSSDKETKRTFKTQTKNDVNDDKPDQPPHSDINPKDVNPSFKMDSPLPQHSKQSIKLVPVTLVLKSPIDGIITQILDFDKATETESASEELSAGNDKNSKKQIINENTKQANSETSANNLVISVANPERLQLIGTLPLTTESQLSVGKPVYFTVHKLHKEFTGQISHIIPHPNSNTLTVKAPLVAGENNKAFLKVGMQASMSIEYGQIELAVRLPRNAIHETNLEGLTQKRPRPSSPLKGYIWVIEQDQTLSYTPVKIVKYVAESDKFLVSGISNESLVFLGDLPKNSVGKKVSVD